MVLQASDELRHSHMLNDDFHWRESLYFNFNDVRNGIGAWIYLWVVPNQPKPSGMLVSFYHGGWPELTVNDEAMSAPGHRLSERDRWVYCFKKDADHLLAEDFDDVELFGLKLERLEPLKSQRLTFDDGENNGFDLLARFMTPPYDYADGVNSTPGWIAANRYHRSWAVSGSLRVGGKTFDVEATGDSDHSWGQRHNVEFAKNLFKMWSFQAADGSLSISVLKQGVDDKEIALGFVSQDGKVASAANVETSASYDDDGVQSGVRLLVVDELGREVRATMPKMHSFIGAGSRESFWGFEGVGDYLVEGVGRVPGLISYFWPARVTPKGLQAGDFQ
ncbi:DUF7064 domain-containing protein [Phenylobacterium sp.]|jgi:hypothetical protein|uniref:DUF7064 domain-containing protein n=1 Tax=Phenylobacterium sp. TaxID=1871053 RepID=UPI002F3EDB01